MIAVDVDGTLSLDGEANTLLIDWLHKRKAEGYKLMLWSSRGEAHAHAAAIKFGCLDLFDWVIPKPCAVVDDQGWSWVRYTQIVTNFSPEA